MKFKILITAAVFTLLLTSCGQPAAAPTTPRAQELKVQAGDEGPVRLGGRDSRRRSYRRLHVAKAAGGWSRSLRGST